MSEIVASEIVARVVTVSDPRVQQLLHGKKATICDVLYQASMCHQVDWSIHRVFGHEDYIIDPEQTQIGLCKLTGVACLYLAENLSAYQFTTDPSRPPINCTSKRCARGGSYILTS